jgi:uncharacterized membrane protein YeaQ/YmgE (transglycosylase-associated protein family)/ribosomal protein L11
MVDFQVLWQRLIQGVLTDRMISVNLGLGNITPLEANVLRSVLSGTMTQAEALNIVAGAGAAAPAAPAGAVAGPRGYYCASFVDAFKVGRATPDDVDKARDMAVDWDQFSGRWPIDHRVTADIQNDPFALRVLKEVVWRTYDQQGKDAAVDMMGRLSYNDLLRLVAQLQHNVAASTVSGALREGSLDSKAVGAAKMGIALTKLPNGQTFATMCKHHFGHLAALSESFRKMYDLVALAREGNLKDEDVQKFKEGDDVFHVDSPWALEDLPEEQELRQIIGEAEYRFLNLSTFPDKDTELPVFIRDYDVNGQPLMEHLADKLGVPEVDLWNLFGGRPAAAARAPVRDRSSFENSVFYDEQAAEYFANFLSLPLEVVREDFTRHKALADEILLRQSVAKSLWRRLWGLGSEEQEIPGCVNVAVNTVLVGGAGAAVGVALATIIGIQNTPLWPLWYLSAVFGAVMAYVINAALRRVKIGNLPRMGVVFPMILSVLIIAIALGSCAVHEYHRTSATEIQQRHEYLLDRY